MYLVVPVLCLWIVPATYSKPVVPNSDDLHQNRWKHGLMFLHNNDARPFHATSVQNDRPDTSGNESMLTNGAQTFSNLPQSQNSILTDDNAQNPTYISKVDQGSVVHQDKSVQGLDQQIQDSLNISEHTSQSDKLMSLFKSAVNTSRKLHSKNSLQLGIENNNKQPENDTSDHLSFSPSIHLKEDKSSKNDALQSILEMVFRNRTTIQRSNTNDRPLQLKVRSDLETEGDQTAQINELLLTVGTTLAALFSLGLIVGLFCCCQKKTGAEDNVKVINEVKVIEDKKVNGESEDKGSTLLDVKNTSQLFNTR